MRSEDLSQYPGYSFKTFHKAWAAIFLSYGIHEWLWKRGQLPGQVFMENFMFTQEDAIVRIESEQISTFVVIQHGHLLSFMLSISFKYGSHSLQALPGKGKGHVFCEGKCSESLIVQIARWDD
jgi:hypothetical protein